MSGVLETTEDRKLLGRRSNRFEYGINGLNYNTRRQSLNIVARRVTVVTMETQQAVSMVMLTYIYQCQQYNK